MPDAWDIVPEKEREADTLATFIIFCEGDITEPFYFKDFEVAGKLKINTIPNQKQGTAHINNAVERCKEQDLIEAFEGGYKLKTGITENIWCVYDRDLENEDLAQIKAIDDNDFTQSIVYAQHMGLKVAWSNDAFELWLLLHFEDVPTGQRLHRNYVYERLTEIFKNLDNQSSDLSKLTNNPMFSYKDAMKGRLNFITHVRPLLNSRRDNAIAKAKSIKASYNNLVVFHDRNPCTMVYELVEDILANS